MKRFAILIFSFFNILIFNACTEDIDESNLYTFTGETIEDYLANRSEQFSSFNYILQRIGYDKILSAYGTYTCFAPTNDAVQAYIDSLYDDTTNKNLVHNGMTARSLEGLTDSLCNDIALFHLLNTKVMGVNMGNGMTIKTLLGRDINTSIDSISGQVVVSRTAFITSMDNELENGVLHELNHVITRSNLLVAGEMESHPDQFNIFSLALKATALADSLTEQQKQNLNIVVENKEKYWVPEKCEMGYTIFAETDDVFRANGINNVEQMAEYAAQQYARCAENGSGWYDYARNHNIQISTGTDYENPWNVLNMFVRYHIVAYKVPWDKLVYDYNQVSKVTLCEYYETMLPYTLIKLTRNSGKRILNRWIQNNTLTDRVAELGTNAMHAVMFEGVELVGQNSQVAAANGYIHPIKSLLVYNEDVPHGALNERMRFDDTSLLGEMMSNSIRGMTFAEMKVRASEASTPRVRFPSNYFNNIEVYNGEDTQMRYLAKDEGNYSNYQGDEFLCVGAYDFALRLPPVPDGTYELRMGYTAENARGMLQFYIGRSSDQTSMQALDIPLDMRVIPVENADGTPDTKTGWCQWSNTDDRGVASDANMHSLGYMRGPLYYTIGVNGTTNARSHHKDLRRIIVKQQFEQGEYWLRFKNVLDNKDAQFHLDYIELCPENVYNSTIFVEDMY